MKKAIAFINLIFLLATLFVVIMVVHDKYYPTLGDLEPAINNLKALIQPAWHQPITFAIPIFWVVGFLTSFMVLRETSAVAVVTTETRPATDEIPAPPTVDAKAELEKEVQTLKNRITELEKDRESLRLSSGDLESEIKSLQSQLEKFSGEAGETEAEKSLKSRIAELEDKIKAGQTELETSQARMEELSKSCASISEEKSKMATENEALTGKIDKLEQEIKATRKESERNASQIKTFTTDSEKKDEELKSLKSKLKELEDELKSAQANVKGGKDAIPPAAYQILYLFQKEGRLIDLLAEDISELDDETLGGAIRPIHEGCRRLLDDRLILERVLDEDEGSEITLDEIDPEAIKLSGRVPASGPYKGELIHKGWRLKECNLPELVDGWKGNVIAPAEIEIS